MNDVRNRCAILERDNLKLPIIEERMNFLQQDYNFQIQVNNHYFYAISFNVHDQIIEGMQIANNN